MKKKGLVVGQMILLALSIAVVIFVVYAFLAPGKALAKAKDEAFSFGQEELSETGVDVPDVSEKPRIPSELVEYLIQLASKIREAKTGEKCLVYIGEIPKLDDFVISLSEGKAEIRQKKEKGIGEGYVGLPLETESIEGFNPCIVQNQAAVNFHNCYFKNNKDDTCNKDLFQPVNQIILEKDEEYSEFLFKSEQNYCFIKLYNDMPSWWCTGPRNNGAEGIDNDCKDEIKNIGNC